MKLSLTFFFSFILSTNFLQSQSCYTTLSWEIDGVQSDTLTICAVAQNFFGGSNWFHGVDIKVPDGWELISLESSNNCGEGDWVWVEEAPHPILNGGLYYDANAGGPQDGNPFNNYGASDCSVLEFCFQVRVAELNAAQLNALSDSQQIEVIIVGDDWIIPGWGGPVCPIEDLIHYIEPDISLPPFFNGVSVSGTIPHEDNVCLPSQLTLELLNDDAQIESQVAQVSSTGDFEVFVDNAGQFDLTLKGDGFLAQKFEAISVESGTTVSPSEMLAGDLNDDNQINIIDFSALTFSFGFSLGDDNYLPANDLNCDENVNIVDFSILAGNFGLIGE